MKFLITFLAFGAGFLVVFAFNMLAAELFEKRKRRAINRLEREMKAETRQRARGSLEHKDLFELASQSGPDLSEHVTLQERLERLVDQSGTRISSQWLRVISLSTSVAVGTAAGLLTGRWYVALPLAMLSGIIPIVWVYMMRKRRLERLRKQLPDVFDLMGRVLRAGRTIPQALQSVADEFPRPAAEEFGYAYEQQNLGLPPEAAMRDLARRTGLLELQIFVLAVMIHQQTGGNLADLLDKLSAVTRDRVRIQGMIRALTAEGRLQGVLLCALPPFLLAIIMVINRPYALMLFEYPILLFGMFGFMAVGAAWMHKIINFDF